MGACCPPCHRPHGKGYFSSRVIVRSSVSCAGISSGLLQLVVSMGELCCGVIQPKGHKFCRGDGGACVGLYLLSAYSWGALCWTPLAALCSGVIFHPLLGCLLHKTKNLAVWDSWYLPACSQLMARILLGKTKEFNFIYRISPVPAPRSECYKGWLSRALGPRCAPRSQVLRSCLSSNRSSRSYFFPGGLLAMRSIEARVGQRPCGSTSLSHFKSF